MSDTSLHSEPAEERQRRWRLILGGEEADGIGIGLSSEDTAMDLVLQALYDAGPERGLGRQGRGGSGASSPTVSRWLGDIRKYFPKSIVRVMQQDALKRLDLQRMLLEPEMLEAAEPDVHLVASLIALSSVIPSRTKETARAVVRRVVDELMKKLEEPMKTAVTGALNRAVRNRRPRLPEMDWHRTIRANLHHYQPEYKTIIPERLIGFGRKSRRTQRDIILAIDQSGSMASSVVYSSIFGAVMATLPAVSTRLIVFDTAVADLTDKLDDPVEVLFGTQLGGGTFINKAVAYCQTLIREPRNTIFVLISDLYEGGVAQELLSRTQELIASGVQFITLLALSDEGAPIYDKELAAKMSALGAPAFACTPDLFPRLMAAAIKKEDIGQWAAERDIVTAGRESRGNS
ncbi:MAG: VWA domain-containing protein [Desulfococcaceae bacterium]